MRISTPNKVGKKIEEILPVDELASVLEDRKMAVRMVVSDDSCDFEKETDDDSGNKNIGNDPFESGFGVQMAFTPL